MNSPVIPGLGPDLGSASGSASGQECRTWIGRGAAKQHDFTKSPLIAIQWTRRQDMLHHFGCQHFLLQVLFQFGWEADVTYIQFPYVTAPRKEERSLGAAK